MSRFPTIKPLWRPFILKGIWTSIFLSSLLHYANAAEGGFEKKIPVGLPFRVAIYAEDPEDFYQVTRLDAFYLTNVSVSNEGGTRVFTFIGLRSGQTRLSIGRIRGRQVQKDYVSYTLIIIPSSNEASRKKEKVETSPLKDLPSPEKKQFELIDSLHRGGFYTQVIDRGEEFKRDFPASPWSYDVILLVADSHRQQGQLENAITTIADFLMKNPNMTPSRRARLLILQSRYYRDLSQFDRAIPLLIEVKQQGPAKREFEEASFLLGESYFQIGRYPPALKELDKLYRVQSRRKVASSTDDSFFDDVIFYIARIRELSESLRDIRLAYDLYEELIRRYPDSAYQRQAEKRKNFLLRTFLDPQ